MIYFSEFFKIPGPKELGMSDYNNAMGIDLFPQEGVETWEDYYRKIKKEFPIRYFIASSVPCFFMDRWRQFYRPISDFIYWVKCHTLSSYKFHLLDLRQPLSKNKIANLDCYRYGYADISDRMLYALFNLLKMYLDKEPYDLSQHYSLEEINNDPSLKIQYDNLIEAKAIYHWWSVEKFAEQQKYYDQLETWSNSRKSNKKEVADLEFSKLHQIEKENENKVEEMAHRLLKIRKYLWF